MSDDQTTARDVPWHWPEENGVESSIRSARAGP